jgi:hypothetical protein
VRELHDPVALCDARGRLNPAAVGWSRRPLHDTTIPGWGRRKRWEYWGIVAADVIVGLTISSLDYAGVHSIYVLDRRNYAETVRAGLDPLARRTRLPQRTGEGVASVDASGIRLHFTSSTLTARGPGIALEAEIGGGGDALAVVVPWSRHRFQYTVKDVARPVTGTIDLDGASLPLDGFAVLDHGRGKWPYAITWNWAAGYGTVNGRRIGVQLGGQWTDGTGSTENALIVDGHLRIIDDDLLWTYDRDDWLRPWRITGGGVDVTFTPFHERVDRTNLLVVASEIHQCFGTFTGRVLDQRIDGVVGWAEEARNRW